MIIENRRIANNADIYILTVENNASKLCVSSKANVAINRKMLAEVAVTDAEAFAKIAEIAKNGGKTIFVGTRKQAQEAVKEEATKSESYYVTERWLGGTLTNFKTIRRRIKRLKDLYKMEEDGQVVYKDLSDISVMASAFELNEKNKCFYHRLGRGYSVSAIDFYRLRR